MKEENDTMEEKIQELIHLAEQSLVQRVKKEILPFKYDQPLLGTPETTERVINAVNNTIDDILSLPILSTPKPKGDK